MFHVEPHAVVTDKEDEFAGGVFLAADLDAGRVAWSRVLDRIGEQVAPDLADQGGVGLDFGECGQVELDVPLAAQDRAVRPPACGGPGSCPDRLAHLGSKVFQGLAQDHVHVHGGEKEFGPAHPRKGQQVVDELSHLGGGTLNQGKVTAALFIELSGGLLLELVDEAADMAQGCAQIVRDGIGEGLQFLVGGGEFPVPLLEGLIGRIQGLGLAIKVGENRGFGFQNGWIDGLGQIIHRPGAITRQNMLVLAEMGGNENDGYIFGFLAFFDELGQLEAAGAGHLHVEDDQSKVGVEERHQSFLGGHGFREVIVRVVKNALENREVLRLVIHEQYVDWIRHIEQHDSSA